MGRMILTAGGMRMVPAEISLSQENAFAFRRSMGLEPKNRVPVRVGIERELLDAFYEKSGASPRSGELSDTINRALSAYLITNGVL